MIHNFWTFFCFFDSFLAGLGVYSVPGGYTPPRAVAQEGSKWSLMTRKLCERLINGPAWAVEGFLDPVVEGPAAT